jgi:hypothetical protein
VALADLERLPPWALYGGAGVAAGGGYLLYRRRRSGGGTATLSPPAAPVQSALDLGAATQQPSIVPYYLTGGAGQNGSTTLRQRRPQTPVPAGIPPATGANPGPLPDIPPLLPISTPPPPAQAGPTPPPPAPAPPPAQQVANLPPDVLANIRANGEQLLGNLIDPLTGGTWWFGDKGGVFAVNGARFLGSVPSAGAFYPGFRAIQAIPMGSGYRIVNTQGQTYNFGG